MKGYTEIYWKFISDHEDCVNNLIICVQEATVKRGNWAVQHDQRPLQTC